MSETRRAWSGIGILTLLFVILLILQMVSPYLGWSDPEVEDGFVIDEVVSGLAAQLVLSGYRIVIYSYATEMEMSSDC